MNTHRRFPYEALKGGVQVPKLDFNKVEFSSAYGLATQLPAGTLPEFVFAGRSNVGKSSLINKLVGRKKLARVSGTPGKTATINFYTAGDALLVDLPGYGYARTSGSERRRWDGLINGYFQGRRDICLLLQLLDCRHAPSKDDIGMLDYLDHYDVPFIAILTKYDKLKPSQRDDALKSMNEWLEKYKCKAIIPSSAEKGIGIEEIRQYMQNALNAGAP